MGAHTHDFAVVLSPKHRCHRPDAVEGAGHVSLENLGPGLLRQPPERAVARDPGIVDEEVYAPESMLGFPDELLDSRPVPHIAALRVNLDSHPHQRRLGQQRLFGHIATWHVDKAECDVASEPAKLHRDVPAEPGGSAGDDGNLAAPTFADR